MLKIDRSFVMRRRATTSATPRSCTRWSTSAAGSGVRVVAEGVDSAETCELLGLWGCDEIQGHFLARPMPVVELERWLLQPDPLNRARSSRG